MDLRFAWNPAKAEANERKHGVSFVEAQTVFREPLFAVVADPDHSVREMRQLVYGRSSGGRMLVVSVAEHSGVVRLISARPMTPRERRSYERGLR